MVEVSATGTAAVGGGVNKLVAVGFTFSVSWIGDFRVQRALGSTLCNDESAALRFSKAVWGCFEKAAVWENWFLHEKPKKCGIFMHF